ncbi:MAG TPA: DUF5996 family protein [Pyrinomonadaceae bacterium]|nr:DUF5996 family protein [Pyrinomonadaceae bacterium]
MKQEYENIAGDLWPPLPLNEWKDTYATLHMWMQVIGKIRLRLAPPVNHWWHSTLYLTPRGLTTSAMPYRGRLFEMAFDFIDHTLEICTDDVVRTITLVPRPVAAFYSEVMATLKDLGIEVRIWTMPQEVQNPIPFEKDYEHAAYDREYVNRFWRILAQTGSIFQEFRGRFIGKSSPVHFFWGSLDLAVTRFSGRRAPERSGADLITREAYSHEVISHGFWPGGGPIAGPAFYAYAAPAPAGLAQEPLRPAAAHYSQEMSEFLLMYDDVRAAQSPREAVLEFCQSTYEAGAKLANWDRKELEKG